jgi:hypothetical protein
MTTMASLTGHRTDPRTTDRDTTDRDTTDRDTTDRDTIVQVAALVIRTRYK